MWLFPAAFALHVAEEAPGFTAWARRNASPRFTQRDFVRNNAAGLLMTFGATWLVSRRPTRATVFLYFAGVLTQQVPFNAAFHAATSSAHREYSPGTVTALAQVPLWALLSRQARKEELLTRNGALAAAAIGAMIHAGAVARQVYFAGVPQSE